MPKGVYKHKKFSGSRNPFYGKHHTEETKRKLREDSLRKGKRPPSRKGIKLTLEQRERLKLRPKRFGKNAPHWKGGITPRSHHSIDEKYIQWRLAVFTRDNFRCQICEKIGKDLEPHHIKYWSKYPDLRYSVDNGITLCQKCHKLLHKIYGKQ